MKIRSTVLLVVLALPAGLFSYGKAMLNLRTPTDLEIRQMQVSVLHRFYGKAFDNPLDSFVGMSGGSNVGFVLETVPFNHAILNAGYMFNRKEAFMGVGFFHRLGKPGLRFQMEAQLFTFRPSLDVTRETDFFIQGILQSDPLVRIFTPVVNFGYDGFWDRFGLGVGLDVALTKRFSLIGEYYPRMDSEGGFSKDALAFGIRIKTYGHQFLFHLGNTNEIGNRNWMRGSDTSELYFGISIHRWLD